MNEEGQHIDLFDAYKRNELSDDARKTLETRLKNDKDFQLAYEDYQKELLVIEALAVRKKMKSFMEDAKASKRSFIKSAYLIPIGIAAAMALLLIFNPFSNQSSQSLFDDYYEPFPNLITSRESTEPTADAFRAYSQGNFEDAIGAFDKVSEPNDTILFYKSMSHLALKQGQEALYGLGQIEQSSSFYNSSIWYRGLTFLLLNQTDSVKHYMNSIDRNSSYQEDAIRILKDLR